MRIFTPDAVRAAEKYLMQYGGCSDLGLMKKAAQEIYTAVKNEFAEVSSVCVLCGKGNNSGDGYELARILRENGVNTCCVRAFGTAPSTETAKICHDEYKKEGGTVIDDTENALSSIAKADVLIDAVFGIGFNGIIESGTKLYSLVDAANRAQAKRIALDVPSGVNAGDGTVGNIAFASDITVTVGVVKCGMLSYPARKYCSEIRIADIGISESLAEELEKEQYVIADDGFVKEKLPKRKPDSNKGDFGKLLCVCGSEDMTGAAVMATGAALRGGAGLVTLASEKCVADVVKLKYPEPIYYPVDFENEEAVKKLAADADNYSAVLVGCGFGKSKHKKMLVELLVKSYCGRLIIDADGINMLSDNINVLKEAKGTVIITPHPGEFSRITGESISNINSSRLTSAKKFADEYNCITVLKGAGTIVAQPLGITAINTSGNPGLAKGGSGDVLAGLIAALAANKSVNLADAAICGVYIHGKAADLLKERYSEYGLLPSDLAEEFAKLLP